jgi:hypothetical protein
MTTPEPISRRAALATGLSDADLRRLCRQGLWHRVRTGHYVETGAGTLSAEEHHRVLVRATLGAASDSAVASHVSALILHDLPVWHARLDRAHLTRDRRTGARTGRHLVVHAARLPPCEVTIAAGLRCTSIPRTLIDIARTEDFEPAVVAGDAALHRGLTTTTQLRNLLHRCSNRVGYQRAAEVVDFLDGRSESPGESRSRVALWHAGLPTPELQARVLSRDHAFIARADFLFPSLGVIGEFHSRPLDRTGGKLLPAVRRRTDRLTALGWVIARWAWGDLDDLEILAGRIEAAAALAAGHTRTGTWLAAPRI